MLVHTSGIEGAEQAANTVPKAANRTSEVLNGGIFSLRVVIQVKLAQP
jgi:hypothetical protein